MPRQKVRKIRRIQSTSKKIKSFCWYLPSQKGMAKSFPFFWMSSGTFGPLQSSSTLSTRSSLRVWRKKRFKSRDSNLGLKSFLSCSDQNPSTHTSEIYHTRSARLGSPNLSWTLRLQTSIPTMQIIEKWHKCSEWNLQENHTQAFIYSTYYSKSSLITERSYSKHVKTPLPSIILYISAWWTKTKLKMAWGHTLTWTESWNLVTNSMMKALLQFSNRS